ncbi:hypothetical protein Tco_1267149 [Tanacetum coccineum]
MKMEEGEILEDDADEPKVDGDVKSFECGGQATFEGTRSRLGEHPFKGPESDTRVTDTVNSTLPRSESINTSNGDLNTFGKEKELDMLIEMKSSERHIMRTEDNEANKTAIRSTIEINFGGKDKDVAWRDACQGAPNCLRASNRLPVPECLRASRGADDSAFLSRLLIDNSPGFSVM